MAGGGGRVLQPLPVEEVRRRADLVELVGRRVALKKRGRDWWGLCPFHGEKTPSFKVGEKGFYCFGCGASGGDAIAWVERAEGVGFVEAVRRLMTDLGIAEGPALSAAEVRALREDRAAERARRAAEERETARRRSEAALPIWRAARPIADSHAARYLEARGLAGPWPPTLRFAPRLAYWHEGERLGDWPAMVALIQAPDRSPMGVHRTWLDAAQPVKLSGLPRGARAKKIAGGMRGGTIRLCHAGPVLALAEGIETALSVAAAGVPCWSAVSMQNMAACDLPPVVREVLLCRDGDSDPATTDRAMRRAADFHRGHGRQPLDVRPPDGADFNDVLRGDAPPGKA